MIVLPAGSFVMGSPAGEKQRRNDEGPQRKVRIDTSFAVSKFEITRAQFSRFESEVAATPGQRACRVYVPALGDFRVDSAPASWTRPGYPQGDDHPVTCIAWTEAKAYVEWLSAKTGRRYRLLSEAEWEYAARAGAQTSRPWGDDPNKSCAHANLADETLSLEVPRGGRAWYPGFHGCRDGYSYTAPVGRYAANRFGLHDMLGNVWEWVEDCWHAQHTEATSAPRTSADCAQRVYRGGAWRSYPELARSALRQKAAPRDRHALLGFRVARTLEEAGK
jgi:formylglycine-generating enzyme required for sulfatase activity